MSEISTNTRSAPGDRGKRSGAAADEEGQRPLAAWWAGGKERGAGPNNAARWIGARATNHLEFVEFVALATCFRVSPSRPLSALFLLPLFGLSSCPIVQAVQGVGKRLGGLFAGFGRSRGRLAGRLAGLAFGRLFRGASRLDLGLECLRDARRNARSRSHKATCPLTCPLTRLGRETRRCTYRHAACSTAAGALGLAGVLACALACALPCTLAGPFAGPGRLGFGPVAGDAVVDPVVVQAP